MVQESAVWTVRPYGEAVGDYQMITEWQKVHGRSALPETVIPPLALIAMLDGEPMAFACCYQSHGIGVAFLEWLTTRPGLSPATAREALGHVIGSIKECTKDTHGLLIGYCAPVIAREAEKLGFALVGKGVSAVAMNIT